MTAPSRSGTFAPDVTPFFGASCSHTERPVKTGCTGALGGAAAQLMLRCETSARGPNETRFAPTHGAIGVKRTRSMNEPKLMAKTPSTTAP